VRDDIPSRVVDTETHGERDWSAGGLRAAFPSADRRSQVRFYRLHDNGWVSVVTQLPTGGFAAVIAREGEAGAVQTCADLNTARRAADRAVPLSHVCSNGCTAWFEIHDPSRQVDFTATCPMRHSAASSYALTHALFRLNTLSFWCLQCGRSWPATDEQRRQVRQRVLRAISREDQ
jgi:hypothetical protein